jgi:hypothetical protein
MLNITQAKSEMQYLLDKIVDRQGCSIYHVDPANPGSTRK